MHTGYWGLRYNTPVVFCNAISSSSSSSMRWGTAINAIIGFYTFCGEASALTWEAICQRGDKIQNVKLQCGSSIAPDEMSCHCTGSKTSWSIPDLQNSHWQHFDDIHVEIRWFFSDEFQIMSPIELCQISANLISINQKQKLGLKTYGCRTGPTEKVWSQLWVRVV